MPPKKPTRGDNTSTRAASLAKGKGSAPAETLDDSTQEGTQNTPSGPPALAAQPGSATRPGSAARGRGAAAPKPKFAGRRSANARAELEAAEKKKKEAEAEAAAEEARRKVKEARRFGYRGNDRGGRGTGRGGRGRGGHMGDESRQRQQASEATGIFGSGQVTGEMKSGWSSRRPGGSGGGGQNAGSGSSRAYLSKTGTVVKGEPGVTDTGMGGMRTTAESGGYISSDEDEEEHAPKKNIDQLQVIDLTADETPEQLDPFAPVRLARIPHKHRAIGLTAEDDSSEANDAVEAMTEKRKGKQRVKDVEVTGSSQVRKRPTAYSSSDTEDNEPRIKEEPVEDEALLRPTTPDPAVAGADGSAPDDPQRIPSSPESKRRAKAKIKETLEHTGDDTDIEMSPPPKFQTQAEKDEWDRKHNDLRLIRKELGRQVPRFFRQPQPNVEGDTSMAEEETHLLMKAREQERIRSENVYLFQFPPVLPDLSPITVKPDPETTNGDAMEVDEAVKKVEEPGTTATSVNRQPKLPTGQVGKLKIHKSGKATLDWGGTSLSLGMGADSTFLQNVLIASLPDVKHRESEATAAATTTTDENAVGMGMGQIRGKFVLTPNWQEILR